MSSAIEIDSRALCHGSDPSIAVAGGSLYLSRVSLPQASDRPLQVTIISIEEVQPQQPQPGEGVEALIARLTREFRYPQALVLLANPETALGPEHMAHAQGCGLIAIDSPERELCWDAALGKGLPCYGVRDTLHLECPRATPQAALSALAFGLFTCHNGWTGLQINEDRNGVSWSSEDGRSVQARVLVRDGFEMASMDGAQGSWRDRGDEGTVRLHISDGTHAVWTQPRFIMPQSPGRMP